MSAEPEEQPPPSPCTRVCVLDEAAGYCVGCGRTGDEIARWSSASADEQWHIVRMAAARKSGSRR